MVPGMVCILMVFSIYVLLGLSLVALNIVVNMYRGKKKETKEGKKGRETRKNYM